MFDSVFERTNWENELIVKSVENETWVVTPSDPDIASPVSNTDPQLFPKSLLFLLYKLYVLAAVVKYSKLSVKVILSIGVKFWLTP